MADPCAGLGIETRCVFLPTFQHRDKGPSLCRTCRNRQGRPCYTRKNHYRLFYWQRCPGTLAVFVKYFFAKLSRWQKVFSQSITLFCWSVSQQKANPSWNTYGVYIPRRIFFYTFQERFFCIHSKKDFFYTFQEGFFFIHFTGKKDLLPEYSWYIHCCK